LRLLLLAASAAAEPIVERHKVYSSSLKSMHGYTVIASQESDPDRGYVLLLLLHGLGDHDGGWVRMGMPAAFEDALELGTIPNYFAIAPEGRTGYWTDGDAGAYASWAVEALLHASRGYGLEPEPCLTGIAGLSMGGFGALSIGLQHPEIFGSIVALSPTDLQIAVQRQPEVETYTSVFGTPPSISKVLAVNPRQLIDRGAGKGQNIALVYGSAEPVKFSAGAERLLATAAEKEVEITTRVVPGGGHNWDDTWGGENIDWWLTQLGGWTENCK
jgi:enterochelin esterase-like enzyme